MNAALDDKRGDVIDFRREIDSFFIKLMLSKESSADRRDRLGEAPGAWAGPGHGMGVSKRSQHDLITLRDFDGATFLLPAAIEIRNPDYGVWLDGKPSDIDGVMDFAVASGDASELCLQRFTFTKPPRGRLAVRSDRICRVDAAVIDAQGALHKGCQYFGYSGRKEGLGVWSYFKYEAYCVGWDDFGGTQLKGGYVSETDDGRNSAINVVIGLAFNARYEWSVLIGLGDYPRIRFATDPMGVRDIFKFREMRDGEARRTALCHWVQSHWRKSRSGKADKRLVEAYLRGKTDFDWNGMRCKIVPSPYDLEQYAAGKL